MALPRGTVPGLSLGSPGSVAHLFPEVTPAPAAAGAGRAHPGPPGAGTGAGSALAADTGVIGNSQAGLIVLGVTIAAGLGVAGAWITMTGPARRAMLALAQRRGRHIR